MGVRYTSLSSFFQYFPYEHFLCISELRVKKMLKDAAKTGPVLS